MRVTREMKRSDRSNDRWLAWYTNVAEGFIYVVAFTAAVFSPSITWLQTRIVTRLVQRRIKMKGGETRESVRMITGGSLAFSAKAKGKEFQKNELMIRMLQTQSTSFLLPSIHLI
jgi:hypothetical protein